MSPESEERLEEIINQALNKNLERNKKIIFQEGKEEGKEEIARKLKGILTPEEISKITGLTLATVIKL